MEDVSLPATYSKGKKTGNKDERGGQGRVGVPHFSFRETIIQNKIIFYNRSSKLQTIFMAALPMASLKLDPLLISFDERFYRTS